MVDCLDVPNYNEIYVSRTLSEMRLAPQWDTTSESVCVNVCEDGA